ncbi:MAG TPA: 2-dehydropantoate 2-reductase [Rhizomicrobium sp.]|jgi:2-dehydropantoate 2-reductase
MIRITLIGPGAIGGTAAIAVAERGRDALTVCANQPFERFVWTRSDTGEERSFPAKVVTKPDEAAFADWAILAVKSHQTAGAAAWLRAAVGANTKLAVLQNGVEHRARVTPFVPAGTPVVPVVVQLPAQRTASGRITTYGPALFIVGDDAPSREFATLFDGSFLKVQVDGDFRTREWEKLCLNAAGGALTTLTMDPDCIARVPELRDLAEKIIAECVAVGRAEGATFADDHAANLANMLAARRGNRGNSMFYDRRDGKPLEWDARNGVIVRLGTKHGIPTPVSATLVPLLRGLDPPA